jgi:hypothetical protein
MKRLALTVLASGLVASSASQAVFFHTGSGSIDGSLCVGTDCVSVEPFGFDTVRIKENNLRLHFDDTTVTAGFPANDWRIYANDSGTGGSDYFGIEDATAGRFVFRVFAGARADALIVDSQGDLGLGTTTPATDIDVKTGNTPTLRLQQDGSSGFTAQSWDIAGNEAGFFVRDVTNGSTLPFRIIPGAASSTLVIDDDGDIGMSAGTNPQAPLHVRRTDASTLEMLLLEAPNGVPQDRPMMRLTNGGGIRFQFDNEVLGTSWRFQAATGNADVFEVTKVGTGNIELELDASGNLAILGTLTEGSDRANKERIVPLAGEEVLDVVTALPISEWSYIDAPDVRHVGPMAQDFYAAFGLGDDERRISARDMAGVSLASIQALNHKLEQENQGLRDELSELREQLRLIHNVLQEMQPRVAAQ